MSLSPISYETLVCKFSQSNLYVTDIHVLFLKLEFKDTLILATFYLYEEGKFIEKSKTTIDSYLNISSSNLTSTNTPQFCSTLRSYLCALISLRDSNDTLSTTYISQDLIPKNVLDRITNDFCELKKTDVNRLKSYFIENNCPYYSHEIPDTRYSPTFRRFLLQPYLPEHHTSPIYLMHFFFSDEIIFDFQCLSPN